MNIKCSAVINYKKIYNIAKLMLRVLSQTITKKTLKHTLPLGFYNYYRFSSEPAKQLS